MKGTPDDEAEFRLEQVHLTQQGLSKVLGARETAIMERLWGREQVSVRDVYRELSAQEDIAYTTVLTTMDRLWRKRLLRREQVGRAYKYTPMDSREGFVTRCLGFVMDCFLPEMNQTALNHFVDTLAAEQPELLADLERLIQEKQDSTQ